MNQVKERSGSPISVSKKMCPRAAKENAKKSEITSLKTAHSGLRFHFDRKKLVTHELNFNSVSKTDKVTRCHYEEKSVNAEKSSSTTDSKKIAVLMDTLKISKSEGCNNREKSPLRKEMPKSPVVERLTSKRDCTRCNRCSKTPKEEKSETKPLKIATNKDQPLKTTKKEINFTKRVKQIPKAQPSPKIVKKQCSKLAKSQVEPQEKTVKPKSILVHSEKPAVIDNEKNGISKNCEAPLSPKPGKKQCSKLAKLLAEPQEKSVIAKSSVVLAEKSHSRIIESNDVSKICEKTFSTTVKSSVMSHSEVEKKVEFAWPGSGIPEEVVTLSSESSNVLRPEMVNGSEYPGISDTVACLMNGSHDEHLCDPHLGLESPGGSKRDLVSKIPRKTPAATVPKPDGSFNKDIMPEQLIAL